MSARDEILARVRGALGDVPPAEGPEDVEVPRSYRRSSTLPPDAVVELFVERVSHYDARVHRCPPDGVAEAVAGCVAATVPGPVAVPQGLPSHWLADGLDVRRDDGGMTLAQIDACAAVVTGSRLAIAATGTVVLDGGPDQGRRVLSLVPDHHVCVVAADRIVASVPEAVAELRGARALTFVSGPSATVDIEFVRVGGVHGPRVLDVVLVG